MSVFYFVTLGGGAALLALGFLDIYRGRRRGRPKNDVSIPATVLLVVGFLLLLLAGLPFGHQPLTDMNGTT